MLEINEELAKLTVNSRFSYCGQGHPFLATLHSLAVTRLLNSLQAAGENEQGNPAQLIPPPPGNENSLPKITPMDPMDLVKKEGQLPPFPAVLIELQKVVQNEKSSAEDVAKVVRNDAGLSTFLLRLVNSAFYSFPARVDTVSRAVTMVGVRPLYLLSMGLLFHDMITAIPKNSLNITAFWQHSIATGLAAQEIWKQMGQKEEERLFTGGLLHDIGKLAIACMLPDVEDVYKHLNIKVRRMPMHEAERELLGFDHARFGGMLLRKWNMPASLAMPVLWHHQPQGAAHYKEPIVVHLADIVANALGHSTIPGEVVPRLDASAWEISGLNHDQVLKIVEAVENRLSEASSLFMEKA